MSYAINQVKVQKVCERQQSPSVSSCLKSVNILKVKGRSYKLLENLTFNLIQDAQSPELDTHKFRLAIMWGNLGRCMLRKVGHPLLHFRFPVVSVVVLQRWLSKLNVFPAFPNIHVFHMLEFPSKFNGHQCSAVTPSVQSCGRWARQEFHLISLMLMF